MNLKKHLQYGRYIWRHKKFVWQEGRKLGLGRWQLFVHDWHKLLPIEWFPYVEHFYGSGDNQAEYDLAWLHHQKTGRHHWQWWLLQKDSDEAVPLPMPDKYRSEMLADWRGAGRAINGCDETLQWYDENRTHMVLHEETRDWIEQQLGWQEWMASRPNCVNIDLSCSRDTDGDGDCRLCARWRQVNPRIHL